VQIEPKTAVLAQLNENTTINMRKPFKLRSQGSSFKMMGASSPAKLTGETIKKGYNTASKSKVGKFLGKWAMPAIIAGDVAMSDRDDLNVAEKTVKSVYDNTIGFGNEIVSDVAGWFGGDVPVWTPYGNKKKAKKAAKNVVTKSILKTDQTPKTLRKTPNVT
jgi:hypothetical protein